MTVYTAALDAMAAGDLDITTSLSAVLMAGVVEVATASITGVAISGGVLTGNDVTFPAVAAGSTVDAIKIKAGTTPLGLITARADGSLISLATAGDDVVVQWVDGEILRLSV